MSFDQTDDGPGVLRRGAFQLAARLLERTQSTTTPRRGLPALVLRGIATAATRALDPRATHDEDAW